MSDLVSPHGGGGLKPLLIPEAERAEELARAATLKAVPMRSRETSDLVMLAMGAYTPLDGFMGRDDWRGVCLDMRLEGGVFWPIPITVSCSEDLAGGIAADEEVALVDGESGRIMAVMKVADRYRIDRELECDQVFRTPIRRIPASPR